MLFFAFHIGLLFSWLLLSGMRGKFVFYYLINIKIVANVLVQEDGCCVSTACVALPSGQMIAFRMISEFSCADSSITG